LFLLTVLRVPRPTLLPYTALFRSALAGEQPEPRDRQQQEGREDEEPPQRAEEGEGEGLWIRGADAEEAAQVPRLVVRVGQVQVGDRKSTRLNSSHVKISYAVFCLK